jgi:hypothetical protein
VGGSSTAAGLAGVFRGSLLPLEVDLERINSPLVDIDDLDNFRESLRVAVCSLSRVGSRKDCIAPMERRINV